MKYLFLFALLTTTILNAQQDSLRSFELNCFGDVYYVYSMKDYPGYRRQPFIYNHNRNGIGVNRTGLQINIDDQKFRARLGLQAGSYVDDNYASEATALKYCSEASVGVKLHKQKKVWLDAGIFPSHLGFESPTVYDNPTLTRSLVAEASPYYLTGAKLSYQMNKKWETEIIACNGWQHINNTNPNINLGARITNSTARRKTNLSLYWGNEYPDSIKQYRYFVNFYSTHRITRRWKLIFDIDLGAEQKQYDNKKYNTWMGFDLINQFRIKGSNYLNFRVEGFSDPNEIAMTSIKATEVNVLAFSCGYDRQISEGVMFRTEGRIYQASDSMFNSGNDFSGSESFYYALSATICFNLNKKL
jgi:hypothetical protein